MNAVAAVSVSLTDELGYSDGSHLVDGSQLGHTVSSRHGLWGSIPIVVGISISHGGPLLSRLTPVTLRRRFKNKQ